MSDSRPQKSARLGEISSTRPENERVVVVRRMLDEFEDFCSSDELSLEKLKEWIARVKPYTRFLVRSRNLFLHEICLNKLVTLEMVECILEFCPAAATVHHDDFCAVSASDLPLVHGTRSGQEGRALTSSSYPIHLASANENCPSSAVRLLMKRCMAALDHMGVYADGVPGGIANGAGTPLHYYLSRKADDISRKADVDLETVQLFVDLHPEALGCYDEESRMLPIHVLLGNNNIDSLHEIARFLAEAIPRTLKFQNGYEETPLHAACGNSSIKAETVQLLVDMCPQSAREPCNWGGLPLHVLCNDHLDAMDDAVALDILNILLEAHPGAVRQLADADGGDENDSTPLYLAAKKKSPEFCKILVEAWPESVRFVQGEDGIILPIHRACSSGERFDTVKFLYEQYPDSITVRCQGRLPIHEAAWWDGNAKPEILEFLLEKDPDGATRTVIVTPSEEYDHGGRIPLHLACCHIDCLPSIRVLFNHHPDAIHTIDPKSGNLPLGMAEDVHENGEDYAPDQTRGQNTETIAFLQTQMNYARQAKDLASMTTPDKDGKLPIHHALDAKACLGAIKLMVRANPDSIQTVDRAGLLPLHIACKNATLDVVKFLAEQDDNTLSAYCNKKDSPLHHACHGENCEVVIYLLEKRASLVSERNSNNVLPIQILCTSLRDSPIHLETIWRLLITNPECLSNS